LATFCLLSKFQFAYAEFYPLTRLREIVPGVGRETQAPGELRRFFEAVDIRHDRRDDPPRDSCGLGLGAFPERALERAVRRRE
jgi:hypothetical protein